MRTLWISIIVLTLVNNNCFAELPRDQVVDDCGNYIKALQVQIDDRDNKLVWLTQIHEKDAEEIRKNASSISPFVAFLAGVGTVGILYGIAAVFGSVKK